VAISRRWRYQRNSQTWSRIAEEFGEANTTDVTVVLDRDGWSRPTNSSVSLQPSTAVGSSDRPSSQQSARSVGLRPLGEHLVHEIAIGRVPADAASSTENIVVHHPDRNGRRLQRSQSERIKDRAKAIMKRMDIRSSSRRRKTTDRHHAFIDRDNIVIGDPVLVSHYSASPQTMRMLKLQPGMAASTVSASSTSSSTAEVVTTTSTTTFESRTGEENFPSAFMKTNLFFCSCFFNGFLK
jgi:hypothetical protein